jgi:CheY-like chemotaxis protein
VSERAEPNSAKWRDDVIKRQVTNLTHLVDDLLDVSRITQGKVQLRKEPVELEPLITRAVAMVQHHIDSRKQELSVSFPQEPVRLDADSTRLEQIFVNVLNNAAKFTGPGGRIDVHVQRQEKDAVVVVRDTGVGISPEMLPHIFDLFTQVQRSSDRSQGGLGIGLTVVRSLVQMHGGSVSVASTPGEGSVFTVRLPVCEAPSAESRNPAKFGDLKRLARRILIVDDNPDNAQGMARLLESSGHRVETAHDGPSAIDAARAHRPDVMLLDIGLPGMDGYEVAARIRSDECCKDTVIIGVSGYGQEEDRRRSREAGFNHHLVKPVDYDSLLALIGPMH